MLLSLGDVWKSLSASSADLHFSIDSARLEEEDREGNKGGDFEGEGG